MPEQSTRPVWWVIDSEDLRTMLNRVANGEDPELVYLEQYANSDVENLEGEGDAEA